MGICHQVIEDKDLELVGGGFMVEMAIAFACVGFVEAGNLGEKVGVWVNKNIAKR